MVKETLSARINEKTESELEDYADEYSISKSEATDRLLQKAIRIERGEVEIVPIRSDGGQVGDRIDETESRISELVTQANYSNLIFALGLLYIIIEISVGLPSDLLGIAVGIPLLIALVWVNLLR
jgi:membrane-bound ClpP family serine protease